MDVCGCGCVQSLLDAYKEHAVPLLTPSPPHDTSLQDAMQGLTLTQASTSLTPKTSQERERHLT